MQVEITCRHGSVSDSLRDYITTKSEKLLTYFERVTAIQITIDQGENQNRVEILVDAEHKHNFVAHAEGDEVKPNFQSALSKMEQQIKKYKQKIQDHRRDLPMNEIAENGLAEAEAEEEAESESD
ncbi:ribosome-associated translation inhibitor RaiA [Gimesia sp.]|uniref:ribosome hibernation-promoting factor, HPF/YfiA family n=1 Tax=Gimesia sp. TaxID=2024833 RepID=UPI000C64B8AB|nr:ribosome-associated translation inhibitor RaiA [Gimesia sp.]MAX36953.1 ribosomal subunit interface protein [Gimesia sp.]HAH47546.1 ribosome-associated translation inhibitor RaiA [Planctomycetaceae bacterium]HBL43733.1 ribosome-associated translation inhibitor RaiA [Planctomycetaceae bacterium]